MKKLENRIWFTVVGTIAACLFAFLLPTSVWAATLTVDASATGDPGEDGKYQTLSGAVAAAQDNDTIQLASDLSLSETVEITKPLTLDLQGKMISGAISTNGLLRVKDGGSLTVTDSTADAETKGTITNLGSSLPYCLRVDEGSNLTLEGGVNIHDNGSSTSGAAVYVYPNTSGTNLPVLTIRDANLISEKGYPVKGRHSFYMATVNIEGGYFSSREKNATTSLCNNFKAGSVTLSGGTYANWNPTMDNGRLATGSMLVAGENGITVSSTAPDDPVATVQTDTLSGYLTNGGDLYYLLQSMNVITQNATIAIHKSTVLTYPSDKYYGSKNESPTAPVMTINIASNATLSGQMNLKIATVNKTGAGTIAENFFKPYDTSKFQVVATDNDGCVGQVADDAVVATVSYNGNTYRYTDFSTAWTNAAGSNAKADNTTITLHQDISYGNLQSVIGANLTLNLNGHDYTYTGAANGLAVYSNKSFTIIDNSTGEKGQLIATKANVNSLIYTYNNSNGASITIGEGVIVNGPIILLGDNPALNVYGTIDTTNLNSAAIYNNGSFTTNSTMNLYNGATVSGYVAGIYHPGTGTLNVQNGASVTGTSVGIEIRKGTLNVYDGAIVTGKGTGKTISSANGSGTTTNNAAIAVAQHGNSTDDLTVNIYGGTLTGTSALYESNPHNNAATYTNHITLNLAGGTFNGSVSSDTYDKRNNSAFISGGYYSENVTKYCVPGKMADTNTDANAGAVGFKVVDVSENDEYTGLTINATATTGETSAIVGDKIDNAKNEDALAVAQSVVSSSDSKNSLEKAEIVSSSVAAKDKNEAISKLAAAKMITITDGGEVADGTKVTLVHEVYFDVTVTALTTSETNKSVVLDIKPKYNLKATTATTTDKMTDENTITLDTGRALTIAPNASVEISVALPTGFVDSTSTPVYVQHKGFEYETTLTKPDSKYIATFINSHGFSEFTITTTSLTEAMIGDDRYTNLQNAVNEVAANGTVKAMKNGLSATANKTVTIENGTSDVITITINGNAQTIQSGEQYTFVYTTSDGSTVTPSTPTYYAITLPANVTGGTIDTNLSSAKAGQSVTITVTPEESYILDQLTITSGGKSIDYKDNGDGTYTFTMPAGKVTIEATFAEDPDYKEPSDEPEAPTDVADIFTDVEAGAWYKNAVQYVFDNGIMTGTSDTTFEPNAATTRGMIVSMLHRLEGAPAAAGSSFSDVAAGAWYADPVEWAASEGIVGGYGDGTFQPNKTITREELASILYRYAEYKGIDTSARADLSRYTDSPSAWAMEVMQWANAEGLITGRTATTIDAQGMTTRAECAAIFQRFIEGNAL